MQEQLPSRWCNPSCGANAGNNPDGLPGINLWVDTGNLTVAIAGEDGAGPGTCTDGIDNRRRDGVDGSDPDCQIGEDGSANPNTCADGIDNGGGDEDNDGIPEIDATDPDCLVGDNLGGGNQIGLAAIPSLKFLYPVKTANFSPNRPSCLSLWSKRRVGS